MILRTVLLSFILGYCLTSFSQDDVFGQFYSSEVAPKSLNESSSARLKKLSSDYLEEFGDEKSNFDKQKFVYEYNFFLEKLDKSGHIYFENDITNYLNELIQEIISINSLDLGVDVDVVLTDYASFNAFTNDFGRVYVNVGALARMKNEMQLMYLLAHELSHIVLRHSFETKKEINKETDNWDEYENGKRFDRHEFSRNQEKEADLNALKLLRNVVSVDHFIELLELLDYSANPVYTGEVDFDLLVQEPHLQVFLDSLWILSINDSVDYSIKEETQVSTHPSIDDRIDQLTAESSKSSSELSHIQTGKFEDIKRLATFLLIDSYIFENKPLNALYLILKFKENISGPIPTEIQERMERCLVSILQLKYYANKEDFCVNEYGNECNNEEFLKFKNLILKMSPQDFNALTIITLEKNTVNRGFSNDRYECKLAYQFYYQFVEDIVKNRSDSTGHYSVAPDLNEHNIKSTTDFEALEDKGYVFADQSISFELVEYLTNLSFANPNELQWKAELHKLEDTLDLALSEDLLDELLLSPRHASKKLKRGVFHKSSSFDPTAEAVRVSSSYISLPSLWSRFYWLDVLGTVELEDKVESIRSKYDDNIQDFSPSVSNVITVKDNYFHKLLRIRLQEERKGVLHYSPIENDLEAYSNSSKVKYTVFDLLVVNKNKKRGRKNNTCLYQVYYDLESQNIAFIGCVSSREAIDDYRLENLFYVLNENKKK